MFLATRYTAALIYWPEEILNKSFFHKIQAEGNPRDLFWASFQKKGENDQRERSGRPHASVPSVLQNAPLLPCP